MEQIKIGTCIPGEKAIEMCRALAHSGFESFSINYHMECPHPEFPELAKRLLDSSEGVPITTIGYYCNPLTHDDQRATLAKFIKNAHHFGVSNISTFAGGLEGHSVDESLPIFKTVFTELTKLAEDCGVRLALENCPMDGNWANVTCNIAFNPRAWEMIFNAVPSDNLGLEWEPAHQMSQLIEPIAQLKQWREKIFHIHGKDACVDRDMIARFGVFGAQEFVKFRTPGFGEIDWRQVITILQENGYQGEISIEGFHDYLYKNEWEFTGQLHALRYLKWCRGGEFVANPWN